jgi:predicted RNA polymerase sigma factor
VLAGLAPPTWLTGSYMWAAVLADLHRRAGHEAEAEHYQRIALETAPTAAIRSLLTRRLTGSVIEATARTPDGDREP